MSYLFVTGVTGLLGEYLVRDLTLKGVPLAVLARKSLEASAGDRIEQIFSNWERQLGYDLPRPVVLEGNITKPLFGLSEQDLDWLSRNCSSFLNNAASLTFEGNRPDGEPWVSNLQGTLHAIGLCLKLGIASVHHVSTSYICGLRHGTILESDLDQGQVFANEYEASKCAAEIAIRNAGFSQLTVYRPAIIVGDSETGYTSTYHGFYAPLKAMHALLSMRQNQSIAGLGGETTKLLTVEPWLKALGLTGTEHKNFVPVQWVSQVISSAVTTPSSHGNTFHLTPSIRVSTNVAAEAIQAALQEDLLRKVHSAGANATGVSPVSSLGNAAIAIGDSTEGSKEALGDAFAGQVSVYQEYWRDDPVFDSTNRIQFFPELVCPELTFDVLKRLCDFSLKSGFGWPKRRTQSIEVNLASWLTKRGILRNRVHSPVIRLVGLGAGGGAVVIGLNGTEFVFDFGANESVSGWQFRMDSLIDAQGFVSLIENGSAKFITDLRIAKTSDFEIALKDSNLWMEKLDQAMGVKAYSEANTPTPSNPQLAPFV